MNCLGGSHTSCIYFLGLEIMCGILDLRKIMQLLLKSYVFVEYNIKWQPNQLISLAFGLMRLTNPKCPTCN